MSEHGVGGEEHSLGLEAAVLEMSGREYMVWGIGYLRTVEDIKGVVLASTPTGTLVWVRDVGHGQLDLAFGVGGS